MYHGSITNVLSQVCTYELDEVVLAMENFHVLVSASSMYLMRRVQRRQASRHVMQCTSLDYSFAGACMYCTFLLASFEGLQLSLAPNKSMGTQYGTDAKACRSHPRLNYKMPYLPRLSELLRSSVLSIFIDEASLKPRWHYLKLFNISRQS
jgi:hypothetical protein